jgi:hypothetical protein
VLESVAYLLNVDSRFMMHCYMHMHPAHAGSVSLVRLECLEHVNAHHTVSFSRYECRGLGRDRTFLTSTIAKQVAEEPLTYVVSMTPIPSHDKIAPKDEAGAVRAEMYTTFRYTELAQGVTKLELASSLNMKGRVPQIFKLMASPVLMGPVKTQQVYFQHIRPLSECDAEDGRVVGQMLLEIAKETPKDPTQAIRAFVVRTAMLRECGLRYIGAMLACLLSADAQGGQDGDAVITSLLTSEASKSRFAATAAAPKGRSQNPTKPSLRIVVAALSLTEEQASAIGSAIVSSIRQSRTASVALEKVLKSHAVLRTMQGRHAWFRPMLEVLTAHVAAESRASHWVKRLSLTTIAPIDVASDCDEDAEDSFSSVVRPS